MYEYDDETESCMACGVIGCACDDAISGCESEADLANKHVLKTYDRYRAYLDAPLRDEEALAAARTNYVRAVAAYDSI